MRESQQAALRKYIIKHGSPPRRRKQLQNEPSSDIGVVMPMDFDNLIGQGSTGGGSKAVPPVTTQQEAATRAWLHNLGFTLLPNDGEKKHFLEDPLRNGLFLHDLLQFLEPEAAAHAQCERLLCTKPTSLRQAQENVSRALWVFKMRRSPPIPAKYLSDPGSFLIGDKAVIWGLLWHIMQIYSNRGVGNEQVPEMDEKASQVITLRTLGYSLMQKRQLERSLLIWLESLGILEGELGLVSSSFVGTFGNSNGILPEDLLPLEGSIRDGTLLCRLIEKVSNRKIPGWIKCPRTNEVAIRNLIKAVDILRKWNRMGRRCLQQGVEREIFGGDWATILGLLEDIHRAADGVAPRAMIKPGPEAPYIGGKSSLPSPPASPKPRGALLSATTPFREVVRDSDKAVEEDIVRYTGDNVNVMSPLLGDASDYNPLNRGRALDIVPGFSADQMRDVDEGEKTAEQCGDIDDTVFGFRVHSRRADELEDDDLYPLPKLDQAEHRGNDEKEVEDDLLPLSYNMDSNMAGSTGPPQQLQVDQALSIESIRDLCPKEGKPSQPDGMEGILEEKGPEIDLHVDELMGEGGEMIMESFISDGSAPTTPRGGVQSPYQSPGQPLMAAEEGGEGDEIVHGGAEDIDVQTMVQQRAQEIHEVVSWMAGLGVLVKEPDHLMAETASEFTDGILLADLVERLEEARGGLSGISRKPKARATKLQNIRRVLAVLEKKQTIPLELIHKEFEILKGDSLIIVRLLKSIRKVRFASSYCLLPA